MSECELCGGSEGVFDRKTNTFFPCSCLTTRLNEYRFEKVGLPIKYWNMDFPAKYSDRKSVIEKFLGLRKTLKKDHLIVFSNSSIRCQEFVCLSIKDIIEREIELETRIVQFSNLLLEIIQSWKKNEDSSEKINQLKNINLLVLLDLNLGLLKENMNQLVFQDLLQYRENHKLTTIISSNVDRETICNYFNLDDQFFSQYKLVV